MKSNAVLVEDDPQQLEVNRFLLRALGYNVYAFSDAVSARAALIDIPPPVDLVVVDRRLPENLGANPIDSVGDELLEFALTALPDTPFIVFTGYADVESVQAAVSDRGVISTFVGSRSIDRVKHFKKSQSLEFKACVERIRAILEQIDDVELMVEGSAAIGDHISRRLLKKTAIEMGGTSITVKPLGGGLTGDLVADCLITSETGVTAHVIVKESNFPRSEPAGGLRGLLPSPHVASVIRTVTGLCDGRAAYVSTMAGQDPKSLMSLIVSEPFEAVVHLSRVIEVLDGIPTRPGGPKEIRSLVAPIAEWGSMEPRMKSFGIATPRPSMLASHSSSEQHGDLHPGNILIDDGKFVLIDFDNQVFGSSLLDPITLALGSIFHADSPFRNTSWPTAEDCTKFGSDAFWQGSLNRDWFRICTEWIGVRKVSDRELWALVLAYAVRQLKYDDVKNDPVMKERAVALATAATHALSSS